MSVPTITILDIKDRHDLLVHRPILNQEVRRIAESHTFGGGTVGCVDEGLPIAYQVLDEDVPVFASGGEQVGTVGHVVSAPSEDIFHGIVIRVTRGERFVPADQVGALHEHGVDLLIDAAAAAALPEPHGAAPAWRVHEPGVKPSRWTHLVDRIRPGRPRQQDWTAED